MNHPALPLLHIGLAAVASAVMFGAAAQSGDQPARPVDVVYIGAIVVIGAWTALAFWAPRVALACATVSFLIAMGVHVPGFSVAIALGVPMFAAGRAGHWPWGVGSMALVALSGSMFRFGDVSEPLGTALLGTLFDLSLLTVLLLLGETMRGRRVLREEADLRVRLAEQAQQQHMTAVRLRIARDLHDVLAHTVTVVEIHAGVAAENLRRNPERAGEAVEQIRTSSREAMADVRSTISLLRSEVDTPEGPAPTPGLGQLKDLVEVARSGGLDVELTVHGEPVSVRPAVELAAYRVVQEALTNVLRHADAGSASVEVRHGRNGIHVEVRDDGRTDRMANAGGAGLRGMRERVSALGGALTAGPSGDGAPGFTVRARLPRSAP